MSLLGGFLLGGSNKKKWGDHRNKKFFINKSVKALIPFKGGTSRSIETACTFKEVFQCVCVCVWEEGDAAPKRKFCLKWKNNM